MGNVVVKCPMETTPDRILGSDYNSNSSVVERSHRTDQQEFYQLLTYTDDVDLNSKLEAWERFYNFDRPHGAFAGKTPYEVLRSLLN